MFYDLAAMGPTQNDYEARVHQRTEHFASLLTEHEHQPPTSVKTHFTNMERVVATASNTWVSFLFPNLQREGVSRAVADRSSVIHTAIADEMEGSEVVLKLPQGFLQCWLRSAALRGDTVVQQDSSLQPLLGRKRYRQENETAQSLIKSVMVRLV